MLGHKQQCPVCPLAAWSARVKHLQERSTAFKSQKRKFQAVAHSLPEGSAAAQVQEGQDSLASGSASSVSVGPGESDECDNACDLEGERPLSVCFAGVACDGWSSMGLQKRYSHDSELPHSVWVAERIARAQQNVEDLAFVECTSKYPAEDKLSAPMAGTHRVLHLKVDPQAFGFPVSRPRMFAACLNLETIVWAGQRTGKMTLPTSFKHRAPCLAMFCSWLHLSNEHATTRKWPSSKETSRPAKRLGRSCQIRSCWLQRCHLVNSKGRRSIWQPVSAWKVPMGVTCLMLSIIWRPGTWGAHFGHACLPTVVLCQRLGVADSGLQPPLNTLVRKGFMSCPQPVKTMPRAP